MLLSPYINFFFFTIASSTIIAISSSHWLIVWLSLEINMISFIPIVCSSNWFQEQEGGLKYLLFQAFGSSLLLISTVWPAIYTLGLLGLLLKLGAAPFHFWFPQVIKSLSWGAAALLITWQKIAPLSLVIFSFSNQSSLLLLIGTVGAFVGGAGGLAQTHFRALLAYSSISHIGWIIATSTAAPFIAIIYFLFYLFISLPIIWSSFSAFTGSISKKPTTKAHFLLSLTLPCVLSLSGLPPFTGFFPKIIALFTFSSFIVPLLLILGSLINLAYYLNFFFSFFFHRSTFTAPPSSPAPSFFLTGLSTLACTPIPLTAVALMIT